MKKLWVKIQAAYEGGNVQRCHASFPHSRYNVAQHGYGVVSLLLLLNPNPSLALIKTALWHDVAERWTGDIPSPMKDLDLMVKERIDRIEVEMLKILELGGFELTEEEKYWVKGCDLLDLMLWAKQAADLRGDQRALEWAAGLGTVIAQLRDEGKMPAIIPKVASWAHHQFWDLKEDFMRNLSLTDRTQFRRSVDR